MDINLYNKLTNNTIQKFGAGKKGNTVKYYFNTFLF